MESAANLCEDDNCVEFDTILSHCSMEPLHAASRNVHGELQATWRTNYIAVERFLFIHVEYMYGIFFK